MRITHIELFKADIAFHKPFRISLSVTTAAQNVFVRIHGEGEVYGMGEASPFPAITGDTQDTAWAIGRLLAGELVGRDACDIEGAVRAMNRRVAANTAIKSAFDNALHDLASKAAGLPLFAWLGGGRREIVTDNTVGMDAPSVMAASARGFVEDGFRAVKVKLGESASADIARVAAIRDAVGEGIAIRVDANQGWDYPTAVEILRAIEPLGVEYCEQPLPRWDLDGLCRVRESCGIPIMADESLFDHHDALRLVEGDCCDYFNIKLAKAGGIATSLRIASIAEAAGLACMVGCMSETRLGLTAAAHLVSARPVIRYADLDSFVDHKVDPIVGGIRIANGKVTLPDGPGAGADVDPDFLASCESLRIG